MTRPVWEREASRVILLDPDDRVLLFRGCDPASPDRKYWFTAGGGIDDGEEPRQAAIRELREETGIDAAPQSLAGPVHQELAEFDFNNYWVRQRQLFYVLRVHDTRVDTTGFEEIEKATMDQYRWWSSAELRSTDEEFYPTGLAGILDTL